MTKLRTVAVVAALALAACAPTVPLTPEQQAAVAAQRAISACSNYLKAANSLVFWDELGYLTPEQHASFVKLDNQVYPICTQPTPPASAAGTVDSALDQVEVLLEQAVAAQRKGAN